MRTDVETNRAAQARHLQEALTLRVAKGREWATPGVEAALRRVLTGIDSGLEAASPRLQASLRTIADELAGGVEAATPRLHERITRLLPEAAAPVQVPPAKPARKAWLVAAAAAITVSAGVAIWQAVRPLPESKVGNAETGADRPAQAEQVGVSPLATPGSTS